MSAEKIFLYSPPVFGFFASNHSTPLTHFYIYERFLSNPLGKIDEKIL